MPQDLTPIERRIFDYLLDYLRANTYQPSIREIGREFGIKSTKTVAEHLQSLAEKGWVERDPSRSRGVRLVGAEVYPRFLTVRCYRGIGRGEDPFPPEASVEEYRVDPAMTGQGEPLFLYMDDDSMRGEGILSGDLLLVERVRDGQVRPDDIVVARNGREGTVKRLRQGPGGLELQDSNGRPAADVPRPHDRSVVGRVVGVFRRYPGRRANPVEAILAPVPSA